MPQCNSEGIAEFIRLIEDLSECIEEMSDYERRFVEDNFDRTEKYGDKTVVSETQLEFARKLYSKVF